MFRKLTSTIIRSNGMFKESKIIHARFISTDYSKQCKGLVVQPKDQILWINFDRPDKFNAISKDMYIHLTETLEKVNHDTFIKAIVLTGNGEYYSSGNDLSNFKLAMQDEGGFKAGLEKKSKILVRFVDSFINLEKFLIAAVNGPAVGIPVTTLPLCDLVVASDRATFKTPFTSLGQCPEACSSYTFPQILGRSAASELLLLNMTWDAKTALERGLISQVVEHDNFIPYIDKLTKTIVKTCYPKCMLVSKKLIQNQHIKETLSRVNRHECEEILDCWAGEECADAVQKFLARSTKKSS